MPVDEAFIDQHSVEMPATVFPLGATMQLVDSNLRLRDRHRRLNLAGLLDATPYTWVWLDGYRVGRTLVTNGQYRQFLLESEGAYDDATIWNYVWNDLGLKVDAHVRFDQGHDGKVFEVAEHHTGSRHFVDAYLDSLESEVQQWAEFESGMPAGDDPNASGDSAAPLDPRERRRVVQRVFALVTSLLSDAIVGTGSDEPVLDHKRQEAIEAYFQDGGEGLLRSDVRAIRRMCVQRLSLVMPPGQRDVLQQSPEKIVEAYALLVRAQRAWERHQRGERVPLHEVLYPRDWSSRYAEWAEGGGASDRPRMGFAAPKVPWEEQPVTGLTLYEAAAYCAWLSMCSGWSQLVELPSEAQYERAASWPLVVNDVIGDRCVLDPRDKILFPWQRDEPCDFSDLFGQEGASIQQLYSKPDQYRKLVSRSARQLGDDQAIEQLLGFGWQWCRERFDSAERRYSRFKSDAHEKQPFFVEDKLKQNTLPVYTYTPNVSTHHCHFVVRGAPEVLGGPGLNTRRFSMFPLRGYQNVGFRWVSSAMGGADA